MHECPLYGVDMISMISMIRVHCNRMCIHLMSMINMSSSADSTTVMFSKSTVLMLPDSLLGQLFIILFEVHFCFQRGSIIVITKSVAGFANHDFSFSRKLWDGGILLLILFGLFWFSSLGIFWWIAVAMAFLFLLDQPNYPMGRKDRYEVVLKLIDGDNVLI